MTTPPSAPPNFRRPTPCHYRGRRDHHEPCRLPFSHRCRSGVAARPPSRPQCGGQGCDRQSRDRTARRTTPPDGPTSSPHWPRCPTVPSWTSPRWRTRCGWPGAGPRSRSRASCPPRRAAAPRTATSARSPRASTRPVKATPFLDTAEVLAAARETAALGASEFCIVLAVRGPDERTMQRILDLVPGHPRRDRPQRRDQRRHPHRGPGPPAGRGRGAPLQPQRRDVALVLPEHRHHPRVGRAGRHLPARQGQRDGAVLRRPASTWARRWPNAWSC